jgi:hypothetical protein
MRLRQTLTYLLLTLLMAVQASYVALAEGTILWLVQDLTIPDINFWTCVLVCFIPNYIYTCTKAYKIFKSI